MDQEQEPPVQQAELDAAQTAPGALFWEIDRY
jgi:hypothetical protein